MYTALNDPVIENSLQQQLDVIVKHTVSLYGTDCTVILAGGFGRGEGSVKLGRGKTAVPLHDFDTYVITNKTFSGAAHAAMEKSILGDLSELTGTDLQKGGFALGVEVVPHRSLTRLPPDLSTYEMKSASTILYGPDVRGEIPVEDDEIALSSGAITLFHRTTALLKNVEPEFLNMRQYPIEKQLETVYECCKVYTEICTALSLMGGFYSPSYASRAESLQQHYSRFVELERELPNLPQMVQAYTRMKLRSDFSTIVQKPAETWVETRRSLNLALRFFLSKFLGVSRQGSWEEMCRRSRGRLRQLFFHEYLCFFLSRLGVRGSPIVNVANLAFQAYDYQTFRLKVKREGNRPGKELVSFTSPILDVYLSSALVLFALEDDGDINQEMLRTGQKYLRRIFSFEKTSSPQSDWRDSRDLCVEGQRLYFVAKQQKTVL